MAFYHQFTNYPSRIIKTILIGLIYFGIGSFSTILEQSLLDLQISARTTIENIAMLPLIKLFGFLTGTILVGFLRGEKINHQILIMVFLLLLTVTTCLFPFFPSIVIMELIISLIGISNGFLETICIVFAIHLWGKESAVSLQLILQFIQILFALGLFIGPIAIKSFLTIHLDEELKYQLLTVETASFNLLNKNSILSLNISESDYNFTTPETRLDSFKMKWPFIINSIYYLFVFFAFVLVYCLCSDNTGPTRNENTNEINESEKNDQFRLKQPIKGTIKNFVIIVSMIAINSFYALEVLFGSFLALSSQVSELNITISEGLFFTFLFWTTYNVFCILSFIGIIFFPPRSILLFNCVMIMLSNLIFSLFGNTFRWAIWIGIGLMSFGCSSIWATFFSFSEQISRLTPRMISNFMVSATLAKFLIPIIIGYYIDKKPNIFLLITSINSLICFISILILIFIHNYLLNKQEKRERKERIKKTVKVNLNPKKKLIKKGQQLIKGPKLLMKII